MLVWVWQSNSFEPSEYQASLLFGSPLYNFHISDKLDIFCVGARQKWLIETSCNLFLANKEKQCNNHFWNQYKINFKKNNRWLFFKSFERKMVAKYETKILPFCELGCGLMSAGWETMDC